VLGCTFYNNTAYRGGAIYRNSGTVSLTGNLFFGNTASGGGNVVYSLSGSATSYGYNISDKAAGTVAVTGSGYAEATGDLFNVTNISFATPGDPTTRLIAPGNLETLVSLPADFPTTYFDGSPRETPAAPGAMASQSHGKFFLDCSVSSDVYGRVDPSPEPDTNGFYNSGESVTLTATVTTGIPGVTFSHWTINGVTGAPSNTLSLTMDAHKIVRAVFKGDYVVNDSGDTAGSTAAVTLRYALNNAVDGDTITLPAGATISLTEALPQITQSIVIAGNGATLTQSGFTPSNASQLLYVNRPGLAAVVKINRLHFKGGRATTYGGAIQNIGNLTLESCVFSDNQTTSGTSQGGAVYITGANSSLIVRGCTFYNNTAYRGGAIYRSNGTVSLTGNLFFGNTASNAGNVVYGTVANISSGGYNVSDKAPVTGTTIGSGSGYALATGDLFEVTDISFATPGDPTAKPSSGSNLKTLTALPGGFPAAYFDGTTRNTPATAGAVSAD
jgi:hypothetical protein